MGLVAKFRQRMIHLASLLLVASLVCAHPALAARMANAVEQTVILTGPEASEAARFLGVGADKPEITLPLGRADSWAVYLLKLDTREPLLNDNNGSPPRFNRIAFSGRDTLSISPFWLDLSTQLPERLPGQFAFTSPFIPKEGDSGGPWREILKKTAGVKFEKWVPGARTGRCFRCEGGSLCVEAICVPQYQDNGETVKGYLVRIDVRPKEKR